MDFLMAVWCLAGLAVAGVLAGSVVVVVFWLRYDTLKERADFLMQQLEDERRHCALQTSELLELRAALRAECLHVEQLQRQITLLKC